MSRWGDWDPSDRPHPSEYEERPDDTDDDNDCPLCAGTGEGRRDGVSCPECHGDGVARRGR